MAGISTPVTKERLMEPIKLDPRDRLTVELGSDASEFKLHIHGDSPEWFPSFSATQVFPQRIPQRKEGGMRTGTQWTVPATDIVVQLISALWPERQVLFSEDAKTLFTYLSTTLAHQQIAIQRTAEYREWTKHREMVKLLGVPTPPPAWGVNRYRLKSGDELMLHQQVALMNSMHTDGYDLFMEQGTGKTPVIIARIDLEAPRLLAKEGRMHRTLIVAPKNVKYNWVLEFAHFSNVPGKVTMLRGGEFKRIRQIMEAMQRGDRPDAQYTVVIVSYEVLTGATWDWLSKLQWDLAVLDEGHFIKGANTKRSKAAMKLRDIVDARQVLTGTPICNTVFDLYPLFEFTREGGSGFTSRDAFCKFYGVFEVTDASRGMKRLVDVQNLPFMKERLARMSFIVRKSEALPDLPDKVYDVIDVEMTDEQSKVYRDVSEKLIAEIEDELADESKQITTDNILTKLLRLAQITSGFVCYDAISDEEGATEVPRVIDRFDPNPKLEALVEILKEKEPDQKTIIWAHFKQDIMSIMARLKLEGIKAVEFRGGTKEQDRKDAVENFNCDVATKVFVGNPGAGGTGVNLLGYDYRDPDRLTTNCDHVIYFSQDWSHPKRSQSEDRCHRKGTRSNIRISDLMVPSTVDEEIRARVTNKRSSALRVQDLREILSKVKGG